MSLESRGVITTKGREILAKSIGGLLRDNNNNKIHLELKYFSVGEGGHISTGNPDLPFDLIDPSTRINELELAKPILFNSTTVWRKAITEIDYIGNGTLRIVVFIGPDEPVYPRVLRPGDPPDLPPTVYILSEIGLYDEQNNLIFYAVHPPEFKPAGTPIHNTLYVSL